MSKLSHTALAAVLSLSSLAVAQETPGSAVDDEGDDVAVASDEVSGGSSVTVGSGVEMPIEEEPLAITVVEELDILSSAGETIGDRLDASAGIHLQSTNRGAGAPIVRGQIGPGVLILMDGVRFNNPTFRTGPNQYLNLFDPFALGQIELLRGSHAVVHGSDAVGGAINLVPRPLAYGRGLEGGLTFTGGSADNSVTVAPRMASSSANTSVIAGLSYGDYGQLRAGGGAVVPGSDYTKLGGYLRYGHLFGDDELTLSYYGAAVDGAGRVDRLDSGNFRRYDNDNHMIIGRFDHRGAGIWREVQTTLSLNLLGEQVARNDCQTAAIPGLLDANGDPVTRGVSVDPQGCVDGVADALTGRRYNVDDSLTVGAATVVTSELTGTPGVEVVWGADAYETVVSSSADRVRYPSIIREERAGNFIDGSRAMQLGLHASGRYETDLSETARLIPEVGMRLSHFSAFAPDVSGLGDVSYDFTGLVGSAQVALLLRETTTLYAAFNQGFRAPNLQETTVLGDTGSTFEIPNQDLGPERSNGAEVGARLRTPLVDLDASAFVLRVGDYIQRRDALYEGEPEVDGTPVRERYNADNADYVGGELAFDTLSLAGFSVNGDVSWIQGDVTTGEETEPARRVPPLRYSSFLRYERSSPFSGEASSSRVFTAIGVRGAGAQTRLNSGDERDLRICESEVAGITQGQMGRTCVGGAAWTTLDYHVGLQAGEFATLKLELRNLLDTNYRYYGSGFDAAGFSAHFMADLRF